MMANCSDKVQRFLITTALPSTWPTNEPVLFLGEWCKIYSEREHWQKLDSETLPYLWNDRLRLEADYHYINVLYEKVLQSLVRKFNGLHKTNHDIRYWRIVVGPWLNIFIATVYERWIHLKKACEEYPISGTYVIDSSDEYIPLDTLMLPDLIVTDEWNCMLYSFMLKHYTNIFCTTITTQAPTRKIITSQRPSMMQIIKEKLAGVLNRHKSIVVTGAGLSKSVYVKLMFKYGIVVTQIPDSTLQSTKPDRALRKTFFIEDNPSNNFEDCLWRLIAMQLPVSLVENFQFHLANSARLPLPKNPTAILTTNVYYHEDFKIWLAEKLSAVGSKAKLILMQHGGSYGIMKWFVNEDYEIKISDEFLTWGWSSSGLKKVNAFGMLKSSPFISRTNFDQPNALMISRSLPRQSYKLASEPISSQVIDFNRDELAFIAALPERIRSVLMVRLYPFDYGWNEEARLIEKFPDIILTKKGESLCKLGNTSRVVIATYNSTPLLETLSVNIPTIIFWSPKYNELRKDASVYFEELKSIGVFHETPESAAEHLAKVWTDMAAWWQDGNVQKIVQKFVHRFCNKPKNPAKIVASKLLDGQ